MKKILTISIIITLIGALGYILTLKKCNPEFETKVDTVYRTVIKKKLIPVACVLPVKETINNTIYKDSLHTVFDTLKIKEYITELLTENTFIDTLKNDSDGLIILTDKIYMNIVKERVYDEKLYKETKIQVPKVNSFYLGVGTVLKENPTLNLNVGYQYKKSLFEVGINTDKQLLINYKYKIR